MSSEANVDFEPIGPDGLKQVPVIAQALDNQWLATPELRGLWDGRLSARAALRRQDERVRAEYVRALVNGEQTVVNRAYLYNNPAVARDYLNDSPQREAFKRLLADGVLIPFLWNESSPVQEPWFGVDGAGWQGWSRVCQETRLSCLRMDWDDAANAEDAQALGREFSRYAHDLNLIDVPALARVLEVPAERQERLRERLLDVADFCNTRIRETGLVLRDDIYRHFVVTDGANPADRGYDPTRKFGAEIKQLIDLAYNVNLADRLGAYALTPQGSPPRSALQEWHLKRQTPGRDLAPEQLVEIVRRTAFEVVQEGLFVESFAELTLTDVLALRGTRSGAAIWPGSRGCSPTPWWPSRPGSPTPSTVRRPWWPRMWRCSGRPVRWCPSGGWRPGWRAGCRRWSCWSRWPTPGSGCCWAPIRRSRSSARSPGRSPTGPRRWWSGCWSTGRWAAPSRPGWTAACG